MGLEQDGSIRWRLHLRSAPATVWELLASAEGRARFWALRAEERDGRIRFEFRDGSVVEGEILEKRRPERFTVTYFGGSEVRFTLRPDGDGGTELELHETGVAESDRLDDLAGWVSVLLALKAAADFGVDLRNESAERRWRDGFVDV